MAMGGNTFAHIYLKDRWAILIGSNLHVITRTCPHYYERKPQSPGKNRPLRTVTDNGEW